MVCLIWGVVYVVLVLVSALSDCGFVCFGLVVNSVCDCCRLLLVITVNSVVR